MANQGKIWKSTVVTQIYNFWFDIWEKSRFLQNICWKSTLHKWKGENWRFQQKDVFCQQDDFSKRSFTELCGKFNSLCKLWIHDSQVHKFSHKWLRLLVLPGCCSRGTLNPLARSASYLTLFCKNMHELMLGVSWGWTHRSPVQGLRSILMFTGEGPRVHNLPVTRLSLDLGHPRLPGWPPSVLYQSIDVVLGSMLGCGHLKN